MIGINTPRPTPVGFDHRSEFSGQLLDPRQDGLDHGVGVECLHSPPVDHPDHEGGKAGEQGRRNQPPERGFARREFVTHEHEDRDQRAHPYARRDEARHLDEVEVPPCPAATSDRPNQVPLELEFESSSRGSRRQASDQFDLGSDGVGLQSATGRQARTTDDRRNDEPHGGNQRFDHGPLPSAPALNEAALRADIAARIRALGRDGAWNPTAATALEHAALVAECGDRAAVVRGDGS